ncbi:MAG: hypothetical protein J0L57_18070 [Burkholderiales bacterium]|nr:hypothetical protein [Burkholderiales bacterium]
MEPVPYDDFLVELFDRARTVDAIIANAATREFARVLKAAKDAGTSSTLLDSYVGRVREAKRIARSEEPWVSAFQLFETRDRDKDVFHWVLRAEPGDVAIDEQGALYLSPTLANSALYTDRHNLRLRSKNQRTIIVVLVGIMVLLALRALFSGAAA